MLVGLVMVRPMYKDQVLHNISILAYFFLRYLLAGLGVPCMGMLFILISYCGSWGDLVTDTLHGDAS